MERHSSPSTSFPSSTLLLFPACRELRRALGAMTWAVFEDVAHDANRDELGLVAATSARVVAEHLGITAGTAASGLRRLREFGLLEHERQAGPAGRFGLSVYRVLASGFIAIPGVDEPRLVPPCVVNPGVEDQHMDEHARARRPAHAGIERQPVSQLSLLHETGDG